MRSSGRKTSPERIGPCKTVIAAAISTIQATRSCRCLVTGPSIRVMSTPPGIPRGCRAVRTNADDCTMRHGTIGPMIDLQSLLEATHGRLAGPAVITTFHDWCYDSRLARPGQIFVAIRTDRRDGHAFIQDAIAKGCTGVLCERPPDP